MKTKTLFVCMLMFITMSVQAVDLLDITVYRVYHIYTGAATKVDAFFMASSTKNTVEKDGKKYCVYELSVVPSYCTEMPRTLLYRQDGKRIYRYDETQQTEVLMFDFSLNEGDVFTTSQGKQMEVVGVSDCKEYLYDWLLWDYQENEGRNVYIGENVTNEAPQGSVVVKPNAHLTVKGLQSVQTTDNLEVKVG